MSSRDAHLEWLAQPLLEHAGKVLAKDINRSGQRLYDHWCKRTRKECFMASYQNEFFRAAYCTNRLTTSARSYLQAAERIRADVPQFLGFIRSVRHVISVGCGPGSDVIGLLAFLHAQQQQTGEPVRDTQQQQRVVFYLLDQCEDWADYITALDGHLVNTGSSLWFKTLRFKDIGHEVWLPPADMIVFSFANTALMDPQLWPLLVKRYPLVLVLDSVRETLKEEYDDCKFNSFQLNDRTRCYYHLAGHSNPASGAAALPPPSSMSDGGGGGISDPPLTPSTPLEEEATVAPPADDAVIEETPPGDGD